MLLDHSDVVITRRATNIWNSKFKSQWTSLWTVQVETLHVWRREEGLSMNFDKFYGERATSTMFLQRCRKTYRTDLVLKVSLPAQLEIGGNFILRKEILKLSPSFVNFVGGFSSSSMLGDCGPGQNVHPSPICTPVLCNFFQFFNESISQFFEEDGHSFGIPKSIIHNCGLRNCNLIWKRRNDYRLEHLLDTWGYNFDEPIECLWQLFWTQPRAVNPHISTYRYSEIDLLKIFASHPKHTRSIKITLRWYDNWLTYLYTRFKTPSASPRTILNTKIGKCCQKRRRKKEQLS